MISFAWMSRFGYIHDPMHFSGSSFRQPAPYALHTAICVCVAALQVTSMAGCSKAAQLGEWKPSDHQSLEQQTSRNPQDQQAPQAPPSGAEPSSNAPAASDGGTDTTRARAAEALWTMSCAPCHGATGRGDGTQSPPGATLANMTDPAWQKSVTDEQVATAIANGRGMMPAFGKRVRPEGIEALVRHIRTLSATRADR